MKDQNNKDSISLVLDLDFWIAGYGFEAAAFSGLTAVAASTLEPNYSNNKFWWFDFCSTLPYSYLCAYSVSRVLMAYVRKSALKGLFFEIHKAIGAFCVMYSVVAWYKLIILKAQPIQDPQWQFVDSCIRAAAAASTLWNELSGIILFPHVTLEAPLILRQIFSIGTSMGLATYLLLVVIQLRAWYPQGNNILVTIVSMIAVLWNCVAVSFGLRAAYILSYEKQLTDEELEEFEAKRKQHNLKKKPPIDVRSFFRDIYVSPDKYDGTMCTKAGLQFIPYRSKRVAQAVTLSTSSIPGIIMGMIALNLAGRTNMAVLGPDELYRPMGIHYTLTVVEMMAFCIIPSNMLDLTLVLRKRMIPHRAAIEVPASFLSSMFATWPLCFALFANDQAWEWISMVRAMIWPLTGSNFWPLNN